MSPDIPMVYVEEPLRWEYKRVARRLKEEEPLAEEELNELGKEGWELAGIFTNSAAAYFYLKRPAK